MVAKIFIDGEAGTTGLQIRQRLGVRDDLEVLSIAAEQRKDIGARTALLNEADVAILCLPDEAARESVALIENDTTRVIDASTAHRVANGWTYGFAEMTVEQAGAIENAKRVANPGCWPQGVIALVRPLIEAGLIPASTQLSVNGISGYSGGGRKMIEDYETRGEDAPAFMPYGLTFEHKHLPEMQQFSTLDKRPLFVPAVGNYYKGMLVSVPLSLHDLDGAPKGKDLHAALADHFAGVSGGFIEVMRLAESTRTPKLDPESLNDSNRMRLHVFTNDDKGQALLVAIYDNLGKGASGAAVQNLNLMLGLDGATGLTG